MSDILDLDLNDLADMPEFKVFKPGAHKVTCKLESKKIGEHPAVEAKFTLVETVELNAAGEEPDAPGTESSTAYMLDNDLGQGQLKEFLKPLAENFGVTKFAEIAEQVNQGVELLIVTATRQNKDKTQTYLQVKKVAVV